MQTLQNVIENGIFVSKSSWKGLVMEKFRESCAAERVQRVQVSPVLTRIINIRGVTRDYIILEFCKQFPKYLSLAYKAARMLGRMFSIQMVSQTVTFALILSYQSQPIFCYTVVNLSNFVEYYGTDCSAVFV